MSHRLTEQMHRLSSLYSPQLGRTVAVEVVPMSLAQRHALVNNFACVHCDSLCFLGFVECDCAVNHLEKRQDKEANIDLNVTRPYICINCALDDGSGCNCDPHRKRLYLRAGPAQVSEVLDKGALWITRCLPVDSALRGEASNARRADFELPLSKVQRCV